MSEERTATERILAVLRPFASNWSGTLGRGDLVIPQREMPRLIHDILSAVQDSEEPCGEAADAEVFRVVSAGQRLPSMQDLVRRLRETFLILRR